MSAEPGGTGALFWLGPLGAFHDLAADCVRLEEATDPG